MGNILKCKPQKYEGKLMNDTEVAGASVVNNEQHQTPLQREVQRHLKLLTSGKPVKRTTNPFLEFLSRLRSKQPGLNAKELARVAGKRWRAMTPEQRQKYIDLACEEKQRRDRIANRQGVNKACNSSKRRCRRRKKRVKRC